MLRMLGKPLLIALALLAAMPARADGDMQPIGRFAIDRTEVSVGAFRRFVAATKMVTMAERQGGGSVFEAGWVRKPSWTWRTPFGETMIYGRSSNWRCVHQASACPQIVDATTQAYR